MAKTSIKAGTTSYLARVFIQDSSKTDGSGLAGLTFSSVASWKIYTARDDDGNAAGVGVSLQAGTRGTWSSGGFVEKDSTNMIGVYEIGIPNASIASGSKTALLMLKGATNMAPLVLEYELTATDNQDSVRAGMTALPNAAAGASGGALINGSNSGTVTLAALTCTGSFTISDGLLISRSSGNTSAITATGNGTGSGAVFTSGSGATGDGVQFVSAATNGHGATFTHAGTGKDFNATTTPLTLAKTTNLTGLNDIAATAIVSSGAITTSGGAVSTVTTTTTATNLTNAPTAGDFTAAMKTSLNAATPAVTVSDKTGFSLTSAYDAAKTAGDATAANQVTINSNVLTRATPGDAMTLTAAYNYAKGTVAMTESYAANGVAPTPVQATFAIHQWLMQFGISGTNYTVKKLDNATTAFVGTLDDATSPTSAVRT